MSRMNATNFLFLRLRPHHQVPQQKPRHFSMHFVPLDLEKCPVLDPVNSILIAIDNQFCFAATIADRAAHFYIPQYTFDPTNRILFSDTYRQIGSIFGWGGRLDLGRHPPHSSPSNMPVRSSHSVATAAYYKTPPHVVGRISSGAIEKTNQ